MTISYEGRGKCTLLRHCADNIEHRKKVRDAIENEDITLFTDGASQNTLAAREHHQRPVSRVDQISNMEVSS